MVWGRPGLRGERSEAHKDFDVIDAEIEKGTKNSVKGEGKLKATEREREGNIFHTNLIHGTTNMWL